MNSKKETRNIFLLKGASTFLLVVFVVLGWTIVSKTSSEVADISLNPSSLSVEAGKDFTIDVILDTKENRVVVAKAIVEYDKTLFSLVSWDTSNSSFVLNNKCIYNEKPCEIIRNFPAEGKIIITLAKPSPGVNVPSGLIAKLKFKALKAGKSPVENIKINYKAFGSYDDSDVIIEGNEGKDILNSVGNVNVSSFLPKPKNVLATGTSPRTINLLWEDVADNVGVVGYRIYRNGTPLETEVLTKEFIDKDLSPETSYSYEVVSFDGAGSQSDKSDPVIGETLKDETPPTVPQYLSATVISSSQINLAWKPSSDDVGFVAYKVFRDGIEIGKTEAPSFEDKGLFPGTSYAYQISAFDSAGNESEKTSKVLAKTSETPGDDDEPPTVPQNVSAKGVSSSEIEISWSASTDNVGVAGYKILRDNKQIGISNKLTHKDTGLTSDTSYSYSIIAFDAEGNQSAQSDSVSAKTLQAGQVPTVAVDLKVASVSTNSVSFSWNASVDDVSVVGYDVYRNEIKIGTTVETMFEDVGLQKGTEYRYTLKAFDGDGNYSEVSAPLVVKTSLKKYTLEDLIKLFAEWLISGNGLISDVDEDGIVNTKDLGIMMSNWE